MPTGVYERTKRHRQIISEAMKKNWRRTEYRKKIAQRVPWNKGGTSWSKGKHFSEEHRKRISEANKGKRLSKEHRKKLSEARIGKPLIEETKRKISEALRGEKNPFYGKHHTEEARRKISEARKRLKGKLHHTEETKRKISEAHKGTKNPNYGKVIATSFKKGNVPWILGKHHTEEAKRKLSEWHTGKHLTDEHRKKISEGVIRSREKGLYIIRPTTPEKKFIEICTKYDLPFKYVGNGKFWIGNVNPDFVESNGRKMAVEIYGDYWHKLPRVMEKDEKKPAILNKYGWKLLVIWEHELNELSEEEIAQRVASAPSSPTAGTTLRCSASCSYN